MGSIPTEGKIRFSQFTLFYRVECEKLFCKTNIKLKVLKLNKTNVFDSVIVRNCPLDSVLVKCIGIVNPLSETAY